MKSLQKLKHDIAQHITDSNTFRDIYELTVEGKRVLLFQIPAAPRGIPMAWQGHFYARRGESLVALDMNKYEEIRRQTVNEDWTAERIRNYRFKIYPKNSLIPAEVWKYDTESILEGMHNSIAHQKYDAGARIIVTEKQDSLKFQNDGSFYEGDYKQYITGEKTPKSYRNPALVKAMVNIKMIDTQGYGIHKMFQSQKDRFLPMPDYDLSSSNEVILNLPGTIIDENYSLMLMENQELTLTDAVLLDQVQKGRRISSEAVAMLRKRKLIEGRLPHIFVSKNIAQATDQKVEYSKHKGLVDRKCEVLLLESLKDHGSLTKKEIVRLLWDVLSDQLNDKQKNTKIYNILRRLRETGKIVNRTTGNKSLWSLAKT